MLDTRIPLGVQQVDIASPLANLIQTRQVSQDRAAAAQDREREIARQATQDQQRNTEFNQNSQLNAAKIEEFRSNKATQQYMQDTLTVKNLLESNNPQDAALVVQGMQERFKGTDYAQGLDVDYQNIVNGNLEPVLSGINSEIQVFQQMGKMAAPAGRQVQKVAPGETLVDEATGQSIFQAPDRPQRDNARDARVQEYMDNFGLSRPQAIARLDAQFTTDPVSGNLISIDRTTGAASLPSVDTGAPPAATATAPTVELGQLAFDPGKGTGAGAAFIGLYNSSLGQLPFLPTIMGAESAAQQLTILERDAIKALASSTRPAVVEQERILQAIPKAMEWSQNPEIARSKMISFVDLMSNQYIDDLRYARDLSQPKGIREESGRRAREIEGIFKRVLNPEAAAAMLDSINGVEADLQQVNAVPFEQLESVNLENLSDAALDVYIERLRSGR